MKVHWTVSAIESLTAIYAHISLNSPVYARGMVDKITRRSVQIGNHPFSGRRVPEYDNTDIRDHRKALSHHIQNKDRSN